LPAQTINSFETNIIFNYFGLSDIDNDGDIDLISNGSLVHFNDGTGNFTEHPFSNEYEEVSYRFGSVIIDYDGDGDFDLAGVSNGSSPAWLENDGAGNFTSHILPNAEFTNMAGRTFIDVNNDGLQDILYPYRVEDKVSYSLRNTVNTYFPETDLFPNVQNARQPIGEDFDFDGDIDIVTLSYQEGEIFYHSGDGDGTFEQPDILFQQFNYFRRYDNMHKNDIDSDGDIDFVVLPSHENSSIIVFENHEIDNTENIIEGYVYFDENQNGVRDADEAGIPNFKITENGNNNSIYTDNNGRYRIRGGADVYQASPVLLPCWTLTSFPSQYTVIYTEDSGNLTENLDFGVIPTGTLASAQLTLTAAGITRCNNDVPFYLQVENTGCTALTGTFGFLPDPSLTVALAIPSPAFTQNDTLFWNYTDLFANNKETVYLELSIPGVEQLGQVIEIPAVTHAQTSSGDSFTETSTVLSEILCAYDPNDKNVSPRRELTEEYEDNYTLFSEELAYTVRFQNTGNDTAFTVRIVDFLDDNLDWTTFRSGTASHNYYTEFNNENGRIEFVFEDILLPDSTTNLQGSQGFVNFFISTQQDLPEFTSVDNTASIFFDFNPPIITNTIENIMVSVLPLPPVPLFSYEIDGYEVSFTNQTTNDPTSLSWDFGNDVTSIATNPSITFEEKETYTVCLTAENIIGENTYCEEITIVGLPPTANFNYTTDLPQVFFNDTSSEDPIAWSWDFGDGSTSTEQNPTHAYTEDGTYETCLIAENEAGADTTCLSIIIDLVSLENLDEDFWRVFPNPASSRLSILLTNNTIKSAEIFDITGRLIHQKNGESGTQNLLIDIKSLPEGIYQLRVITDNSSTFTCPVTILRQ